MKISVKRDVILDLLGQKMLDRNRNVSLHLQKDQNIRSNFHPTAAQNVAEMEKSLTGAKLVTPKEESEMDQALQQILMA